MIDAVFENGGYQGHVAVPEEEEKKRISIRQSAKVASAQPATKHDKLAKSPKRNLGAFD